MDAVARNARRAVNLGRTMRLSSAVLLFISSIWRLEAANPLTFYFIDESPVDATAALVVTPAGESVLIDTGFSRHLDRVLSALKMAGIKKIDYVVVTHYHHDHAEGLPDLVSRIPIGAIVDHGLSAEAGHTQAWWKERR